MNRWSTLALASALVSLGLAENPTRAFAFDFQVANPVSAGNLGVYFVDGNGPRSGMLSLHQAVSQGSAKIFQQDVTTKMDPVTRHSLYLNGPVAIQNLSATQSIFVQVGALLSGGLQDQVVTRTIVVPPHSGRVTLETLCVDPFRSTARQGESKETFSAPGALIPWRLAKLSALVAGDPSGPIDANIRRARQMGVWWSIDSLRYQLSQKLGVALEPEKTPLWDASFPDLRLNAELAGRHSRWTAGLPLSLQNPELARAEQPYIDALQGNAGASRVIGAIFVINGRVEGADIYQSHDLFAQMWPQLLHAYAAEALALSGAKPVQLLSVRQVREVLTKAEHAPVKDLGSGNLLHENRDSVYAVTDSDGAWVYRSYAGKFASDHTAPEGVFVDALDSGMVDGQKLASLTADQIVVLHHGRAGIVPAVVPDPGSVQTTHATLNSALLLSSIPPAVTHGSVSGFDERWASTEATRIQLPHPARNTVSPWLIQLGILMVVAVVSFLFGCIRDSAPARAVLVMPAKSAARVCRAASADARSFVVRMLRPGIKAPRVPGVLQLATQQPVSDAPSLERSRWQVIRTPDVRPAISPRDAEPFEFKKAA